MRSGEGRDDAPGRMAPRPMAAVLLPRNSIMLIGVLLELSVGESFKKRSSPGQAAESGAGLGGRGGWLGSGRSVCPKARPFSPARELGSGNEALARLPPPPPFSPSKGPARSLARPPPPPRRRPPEHHVQRPPLERLRRRLLLLLGSGAPGGSPDFPSARPHRGVPEPFRPRRPRRAQPRAAEQAAGAVRGEPAALGIQLPDRGAAGRRPGQAAVGRGGRRRRARFLPGEPPGGEVPLPGAREPTQSPAGEPPGGLPGLGAGERRFRPAEPSGQDGQHHHHLLLLLGKRPAVGPAAPQPGEPGWPTQQLLRDYPQACPVRGGGGGGPEKGVLLLDGPHHRFLRQAEKSRRPTHGRRSDQRLASLGRGSPR